MIPICIQLNSGTSLVIAIAYLVTTPLIQVFLSNIPVVTLLAFLILLQNLLYPAIEPKVIHVAPAADIMPTVTGSLGIHSFIDEVEVDLDEEGDEVDDDEENNDVMFSSGDA